MTMSSGAVLQQLMVIADLYARKLAADAGPPFGVLVFERDGELACTMLDAKDQELADQVRCLLAQCQATSAVVLVGTEIVVEGIAQRVVCSIGETDEGMTAVRRYRVLWRRLTPLTSGDHLEIEELLRPLFPGERRAAGADQAAESAAEVGAPIDAPIDAPTDGRIVAA
jgi:hypothetical protein